MTREASRGWRGTRLKYLANLAAGGTPAVDNPSYWAEDGAGTPWVTIADMSSEAHLRTTVRSVTSEGLRAARLPVGPPGTLLFAMYASLGTMSTLETHAAWNQAILGIRPRPGIDPAFLRYCLEQLRGRLAGFARSNTQDNLNQGQVSNLELWVPELAVQQAVGAFLDRECARIRGLDDAIERASGRAAADHWEAAYGRLVEREGGSSHVL